MRKIFILIYFLSSILLTAQIKSEYKNAKLLKGNYKQIVYFNRNNKFFVSSGDFFIANGYGICWITKKPKESITVMGEKHIVQILPNGDKKIISDSSNAIFSQIANIIKSILKNDAIVSTSFTEYMHPVFLLGMEVGVPVLIGNNSNLFNGEELEKYIVTSAEDNAIINSKMVEKILDNKEKILELYKNWKKEYNEKSKKNIEAFLEK